MLNRRDLFRLSSFGLAVSASSGRAALLPPYFLDAVVAIGHRPFVGQSGANGPTAVRGDFAPFGTGFFYGDLVSRESETSATYRIFLVTNEHVLAELIAAEARTRSLARAGGLVIDANPRAYMRLNPTDSGSARDDVGIDLPQGDLKAGWSTDSENDIAILSINATRIRELGLTLQYFKSDLHVADLAQLREDGTTEGDGIFILGYPMGQIGANRNYVVVRSGTLARVRDAIAGDSEEILVDSQAFPGNSGGPVVLRPELVSIKGTEPPKAAYLIGVVKSYITYRDTAISQQTKRARIVFEENSGLASVVPIDRIKALISSGQNSTR